MQEHAFMSSVERVDRERYKLGQRLSASAEELDRTLLELGGLPKRSDRAFPRVAAFILLLSVCAGVLVFVQGQVISTTPVEPAGEARGSAPQALENASHAQVDGSLPLNVYLRAERACTVRITIDGDASEERRLQEGDQIVLQPRNEILLETSDAGAFTATINGKPVPLGSGSGTVRIGMDSVHQFLER
jgi:hypothetical protein